MIHLNDITTVASGATESSEIQSVRVLLSQITCPSDVIGPDDAQST